MKLNIEKLKELGYKKKNGEEYAKNDKQDNIRKSIFFELNTNTFKGKALRINKLLINSADTLKYLIATYKELNEDIKNTTIIIKEPTLTQEEKNYLQIIVSQSEDNQVSYIAIVKVNGNRYLRIRYFMSKLYSYIPMVKGFESLEEDKNYTLEELGVKQWDKDKKK